MVQPNSLSLHNEVEPESSIIPLFHSILREMYKMEETNLKHNENFTTHIYIVFQHKRALLLFAQHTQHQNISTQTDPPPLSIHHHHQKYFNTNDSSPSQHPCSRSAHIDNSYKFCTRNSVIHTQYVHSEINLVDKYTTNRSAKIQNQQFCRLVIFISRPCMNFIQIPIFNKQ